MSLVTQLRRAVASTLLGRSSRAEPSSIAWMHGVQGHLFNSFTAGSDGSSSSGPDGSSSSSDDDDDNDDDEFEKLDANSTAASPNSDSSANVEEVYDPAAGFEVLGPAPTAEEMESPSPAATQKPAWNKIDGGFPVSREFDEMMRRVRDMPEEQIMREAEEDESTRRTNIESLQASRSPDSNEQQRTAAQRAFRQIQRAAPDDYLLFAEAIEAYLSVSPNVDFRRDGVGVYERAVLMAMAAHIRSELGDGGRSEYMPPELAIGSPLETRVVNMAPPGRLPWEVLGVDEDRGVVHWAVDLTSGKASDPWKNGRLSDAAKVTMYEAHKANPEVYSVEALARTFKIRQQRVMAILALKELEEASPDAHTPESEELRVLMEEGAWGCNEATGSNERHYVTVPSYPAYAEADTAAISSRLEAILGKPSDEIREEDLTPEIAQQVLGVKPQSDVEEDLAAAEERSLVEEFKRAIDFNMGRTGAGISKKSRSTAAPTRPKEGWSLVVTPLGKDAEQPYVADADGVKRELNADEALMVQRKTPRPRRRIL